MPLTTVTAGPAVQGGLAVGGSSEMDHIESSVSDLCISISCIPGKRCLIGQSSSLRLRPTDGHSCEWSGTNIPSNSGTGVSPEQGVWEKLQNIHYRWVISKVSLGLIVSHTWHSQPSPGGPDPLVFHVAPGQCLVAFCLLYTVNLFNFLFFLSPDFFKTLFSFPFCFLLQLSSTLPWHSRQINQSINQLLMKE